VSGTKSNEVKLVPNGTRDINNSADNVHNPDYDDIVVATRRRSDITKVIDSPHIENRYCDGGSNMNNRIQCIKRDLRDSILGGSVDSSFSNNLNIGSINDVGILPRQDYNDDPVASNYMF
jgi:hypothetical protein